MATSMQPPPRTVKALEKECIKRRLMEKDERSFTKRDELLVNMWQSKSLGRSIERPSILLVGTSGVGKSSTINHLFDLKDKNSVTFAKTSATTSETRATTEFLLQVDSPPARFGVSQLRLALVDTPGFNDTGGTKQDACNFYSIKGMYDKNMGGCKPNLVLILIQATDTRIQGENSNLAKSLKCLKALKLVDSKHPNVVAVLTFSTALGEKEKRFTKNMALKKQIVGETLFRFLHVQAPVVALENDLEDLDVNGDFTLLPDGTSQPQNLYKECSKVLKDNGDLYGHLIFNEAFSPQKKTIKIGLTMIAKNAETSNLSKDEYSFFEFFTEAMAGGAKDPLAQEADEFLKKENLSDNAELVTEIQSLVGCLRRIGVQNLQDLGSISMNGLKIKHPKIISETGKKFLAKLGLKDTTYLMNRDSSCVIGQGFNIRNSSLVQDQILAFELKDSKFGISIPDFSNLKPSDTTKSFMLTFQDNKSLIKDRINHLNVSLEVDPGKCTFQKISGFNIDPKANKTTLPSKELSFFVEERLFELSIENLKTGKMTVTPSFSTAVKGLPNTFDIKDAKTRSTFEQFFAKWGHFVVKQAYGGGSIELNVDTSKLGNGNGMGNGLDIDALRGALMKSFSAGFLDSDTTIEAEGNWSNTVRIKELLESSTINLNGGSQELRQRGTLESEHTMDIWKNSLMINPVMLTTDMILEPISTFVEFVDPTKKSATYDALKEFLKGHFEIVANEQKAEEIKNQKHEEAMAEIQRQRAAAAEQAKLHAEEIAARQERDRREAAYREEKRRKDQEEKDRIERQRQERERAEQERKRAEEERKRAEEANTRASTVNNNPTPKPRGRRCFPQNSTVTVLRGEKEVNLQLNQVRIGDAVLTYDYANSQQVYTELILWADADEETPTRYFCLELEDGSEVNLTGEHLILVGESHRAIMARDVCVGDVLYKRKVGYVKVKKISQTMKKGFCAPITAAGTIMVSGILASCYAYLSDISLLGRVSLSAQVQGKIGFLPLQVYRRFSRSDDKEGKLSDFEGLHPYVKSTFRLFGSFIEH